MNLLKEYQVRFKKGHERVFLARADEPVEEVIKGLEDEVVEVRELIPSEARPNRQAPRGTWVTVYKKENV